MSVPLIEVCIESVDDAQVATAGGAHRIELCSGLALGGLTPSVGAMREVRKATSLPIMTMIRPRGAGFCYSDSEWRVMRRDVEVALEHGADGIVFGVLSSAGDIDARRTTEVVRQIKALSSRPIDVVFHRAFDFANAPIEALDQLIDLGVGRVLTSGQRTSAVEGASLIGSLIERSGGRIEILPGGGITAGNVVELIQRAGCNQVHLSLRERSPDPSLSARPHLSLGGDANVGGQVDVNQLSRTSMQFLGELSAALRR